MVDYPEAEEPMDREAVMTALHTLGGKLRDEVKNLNGEDSFTDMIVGGVREALTSLYKDQFPEESAETIRSLVDDRYLQICETGKPDTDEVEALKKVMLREIKEEWMRDDHVLTFNAITWFQMVQVYYWASQIRDVNDISLGNIPVFFEGHLPDPASLLFYLISEDEVLEAIKEGFSEHS